MPNTAWIIGNVDDRVLEDLTAPDGYPPAQIWIPLESAAPTQRGRMPRYHSAWGYRTTDSEEWIDFAIPADTILEAIGPHALAFPKSLTQTAALASDVATRDGVLMVRAPRFFTTVATGWQFGEGEHKPLALKKMRQAFEGTLAELDLSHYTDHYYGDRDEPELIVTEDGPLLLSSTHRATYYTVERLSSLSRVKTALRKLPPETVIRAVGYTS